MSSRSWLRAVITTMPPRDISSFLPQDGFEPPEGPFYLVIEPHTGTCYINREPDVAPELLDSRYDELFIAAKEEAAMVNMMRENGCTAGVDNFEDIALTLFYALPDVILQLTIWVEPGETAFTSAMLLRALGFLLGVAMSIIVAAIFRTMRTTAVRWAFTVAVAAMMVILLIQHFTGLAQILQARGFPMNHTMFVALAWSINQNSTMIMAQALVFLIPAVASIVAGFRMKTHDVPGANEATLRRHKVFRRHAIAAAVWSLIAAIGVTATLTVGVAATHQTITLSPPEAYSLKDGVATIPFSQVEDGTGELDLTCQFGVGGQKLQIGRASCRERVLRLV